MCQFDTVVQRIVSRRGVSLSLLVVINIIFLYMGIVYYSTVLCLRRFLFNKLSALVNIVYRHRRRRSHNRSNRACLRPISNL